MGGLLAEKGTSDLETGCCEWLGMEMIICMIQTYEGCCSHFV